MQRTYNELPGAKDIVKDVEPMRRASSRRKRTDMGSMKVFIGEDLVITIDGNKVGVTVTCDTTSDAERIVREALEACSFNVAWPPYRQVGRAN